MSDLLSAHHFKELIQEGMKVCSGIHQQGILKGVDGQNGRSSSESITLCSGGTEGNTGRSCLLTLFTWVIMVSLAGDKQTIQSMQLLQSN